MWLLTITPSLAPVLPPDVAYDWADMYSDAPSLAWVLVAALLRARSAVPPRERTLWSLLACCMAAWLAVRAIYLVIPFEEWGTGTDMLSDLFYLTGYLCLGFGLQRSPHGPRPDVTRSQRVESFGTLIFGFGLLAYFVLMPSVFHPELYASWVSSLFLYALLDLYLIARGVSLLRAGLPPEWRRSVHWLLATFALWLVGDTVEGLMYMDVVPWIDAAEPLDLLWHAPALTLLIAVRSRTWSAAAPPPPRAKR